MPDSEAGPPEVLAARRAFLGRLRAAMAAGGISQNELAKRLGQAQAVVSQWFTKERLPAGDTMLRLSAALGVNAAWLMTGVGGMHDAPAGDEATAGAGDLRALALLTELRTWVMEREGPIRARLAGRTGADLPPELSADDLLELADELDRLEAERQAREQDQAGDQAASGGADAPPRRKRPSGPTPPG